MCHLVATLPRWSRFACRCRHIVVADISIVTDRLQYSLCDISAADTTHAVNLDRMGARLLDLDDRFSAFVSLPPDTVTYVARLRSIVRPGSTSSSHFTTVPEIGDSQLPTISPSHC